MATILAVTLGSTFASLGAWQLKRLAWKRQLIATVETNLAAAPSQVPDPRTWSGIRWGEEEYRRVVIGGV